MQLLFLFVLFNFSNQQEIMGSGEYYNSFSSTNNTTVDYILNDNTTIQNVITLLPVINSTQLCLTTWQKIKLLFNYASFDVNQYLNCMTNSASKYQNNNYLLVSLIVALYFISER